MHDPRTWPLAADAPEHARALHALASASLAEGIGTLADAHEAALADGLMQLIQRADAGPDLAAVLASAPSVAIHRHLWRALAACVERWPETSAFPAALVALPVVLVIGREAESAPAQIAAVVDGVAVSAILREHKALGASEQFGIADALAGVEAIDVMQLPRLFASLCGRAESADALDLAPMPLPVPPRNEAVLVRWLVASVVAARTPSLAGSVAAWGIPLAQALGRALARPGVSVLALPRPPRSLVIAVAEGQLAQRETSATLFASNAIRRMRAAVGEPVAIISAHRTPDAPSGGELRVSLSSPFDQRQAEGFRCPLQPFERVADALAMLTGVLADCRVADVRVLDGVHDDRDAATGLPLLFKPETLPQDAATGIH